MCRTRATSGDFSKFVRGAEICGRPYGGVTPRCQNMGKYSDSRGRVGFYWMPLTKLVEKVIKIKTYVFTIFVFEITTLVVSVERKDIPGYVLTPQNTIIP